MDDDAKTVLFQQVLGVTGEKPTLQNLWAQVAETNPTLAPFVNYLAQRDAERRERESTEEIEIAVEQVPDQRESLQQLERTVAKLYRELEDLRERNDTVAAALGACYLCWGDDPQCELCFGAGGSGWHPSDQALFDQWVVPAVRALQLRRKAAGHINGSARLPDGENLDPSLQ